jgi:peptide/nickel transport system ATP-binding protein
VQLSASGVRGATNGSRALYGDHGSRILRCVDSLLEVIDLRTDIHLRNNIVHPVDGISFEIRAGETVGLVGESGCGKTMTGMSVMRLLPPGGSIASGSIRLAGRDLVTLNAHQIRAVRGKDIAMVFQDPMTSLNPTMSIGQQIAEPVRQHEGLSKTDALRRAKEMLELVGVPSPSERLDTYPHQLSGGLRQRVMIAMALACRPKLLIADEPTTALDVTIQSQILELLEDLRDRLQMSMLLITHDMGVIAGRADRVMVMYAGRIVESADTPALFTGSRHPYSEALLNSIPKLDQDKSKRLGSIPGQPPDLSNPPSGCRFAARCQYVTSKCRDEDPVLSGSDPAHRYACFHPRPVNIVLKSKTLVEPVAGRSLVVSDGAEPSPLLEFVDVYKEFPITGGILKRRTASVKAVSGVSFALNAGETFGLVGESGCGKTTVGRLIVALEQPDSGSIRFDGDELKAMSGSTLRRRRRDLQFMFQDPYASLDPRMKVGAILQEPMVIQRIGNRAERRQTVSELLNKVGLPMSAIDRYPHEFSGGQRQRIGFARSLILNPRLIVADEPVSALDVSIQSQVINLMKDLQSSFGLTYVVISHDLSVVKYLADRIGIMYLGKLVESGPSEAIYAHPAHPYTATLLTAIPVPDPEVERAKPRGLVKGELPSPINPPSGCRFHTRCPRAEEICKEKEPIARVFGSNHTAACHFPLEPVLVTLSRESATG